MSYNPLSEYTTAELIAAAVEREDFDPQAVLAAFSAESDEAETPDETIAEVNVQNGYVTLYKCADESGFRVIVVSQDDAVEHDHYTTHAEAKDGFERTVENYHGDLQNVVWIVKFD